MLRVSSNWYYHFRCVARHAQITPNNKFNITLQYQELSDKLIFCLQISVKACYKLIQWLWWGWSSILKVVEIASLQCLYNMKKMLKIKLTFCIDKHQSFLQVYFDTLGIKVSHKVTLSLLMGMIKHSESTQSNKFPISF